LFVNEYERSPMALALYMDNEFRKTFK
jgi:hypothetical protein